MCIKTITLLVYVLGFVNVGLSKYTWGPDTRLTFDDSLSYFSYPTQWSIATDLSGKVHVVWYDQRDPQWCTEVYYKCSTDNGSTWEADMPLTTNSSYWQEVPCVATDHQDRVHVVYTECQYSGRQSYAVVHYKRSTNGGISWGLEIDIANAIGDFAKHTSLATDLANGIYVLYANQTGLAWWELDNYFVGSTDGGQTWGGGIQLTSSMSAVWGSVAADTLGRVHVIYVEAPTGTRQLYYRRSTDSGQSFEPPVQLTSANSNKFNGSIYTDRGNIVHVAWKDNRDGNWEIYYIRSTDGGTTWGPEIRLTSDPDTSQEPNITADLNGGVYLVWTDNRPEKGVYFKYSTDAGNTWSNDTCLTLNAIPQYGQFFPNIACSDSGDYLHVAWQDQRDGNLEVYYKRGVGGQKILENNSRLIEFSRIIVYPNPFSREAEIRFQIADVGAGFVPVQIKIYDASGQCVRDFSRLTVNGSRFTVTSWDGTDNSDRRLPAGIYFVQLKTDDYTEMEKVILLR